MVEQICQAAREIQREKVEVYQMLNCSGRTTVEILLPTYFKYTVLCFTHTYAYLNVHLLIVHLLFELIKSYTCKLILSIG